MLSITTKTAWALLDNGYNVTVVSERWADPKKRITARDMLRHEWWRKEPKPTRKQDLPRKADKDEKKVADDVKRRPGIGDEDRGGKVARKLDFGAAK